MNSESPYHRAKQVFMEVIDLPEPARGLTLTELCADDISLRIEVEDMLRGATEPSAAAIAEGVLSKGELSASVQPGFHISGYEIGECIGSGGMGVVFRARQKHPQRDVAIKILRSAFPSDEMRRRFDLEADILGSLHHPGIAQIFDVGNTTPTAGVGHAFYVMELVEGEMLCDYARTHSLSLGQRLRMMIAVCHAVQHAHQHGVIHRDLKPGNILVGENGQPKILDFGVARIQRAGPMKDNTIDGTVYGTPQYMSPEQATGRKDAVDTRTDVYALGVIAFEMFFGETPYDVPDEWSSELSEHIATAPLSDGPFLDGARHPDLRLILEAAMAKEKEDRYQAVSDLRSDLKRFVEHQPIMARPPSSLYAMCKFTRRHRVTLSLGLAAMIALMVAVVNTTVFMLRAQEAERDVEAALLHIGTSLARLSDDSDPATVRQVTLGLNELLTNSDLNTAPLAKAFLHESMGRVAWRLDEPDSAQSHFAKAIQLAKIDGARDEVGLSNVIRLMLLRSKVLVEAGRDEAARELCDEALALADEVDSLPLSTRLHLILSVGEAALLRDDNLEAEAIFRRVLSSSADANDEYLQLETMNNLGVVLTRLGEYDEAISILQDAYAIRVDMDPSNLERFRLAHHLGVAFMAQGEVTLAYEYLKIAYFGLLEISEPDDMLMLDTRIRLGDAMWWSSMPHEAMALFRDVCYLNTTSQDRGTLHRTRRVCEEAVRMMDDWNIDDPRVARVRADFILRIEEINNSLLPKSLQN